MIEHLKQETFDFLMEIFFEDEATDSPKVNEVNQHISRKECLYILRRDMRIKTNYELEEVEIPNHSYLSQLDVTYKTPDLMSHFLPPHEVSFTFCCSSIVFPR
ncbi:ABC transporter membrane protein [Streptococcus pneumoniae]|nr:ABC transporter membrane protein [Streptococcus pneumoniae]VJD01128.1 ABC transporter membrane protein [Streptococcus pneumoniae]VJN65916.1 ABC transporter membrane protein [Streptococcus pneumoniae]